MSDREKTTQRTAPAALQNLGASRKASLPAAQNENRLYGFESGFFQLFQRLLEGFKLVFSSCFSGARLSKQHLDQLRSQNELQMSKIAASKARPLHPVGIENYAALPTFGAAALSGATCFGPTALPCQGGQPPLQKGMLPGCPMSRPPPRRSPRCSPAPPRRTRCSTWQAEKQQRKKCT